MSIRKCVPALVVAGLAATAVAVAPTAAAAQTGPNCATVAPNSTLCQTNGSASLNASPEVRYYPMQYPWFYLRGHRR